MTINSATGLIKWTPTAKGDYPVTVKVSDGTLSINQNFTIKVKAVNHAPIITSIPITTATVGVTYVYDVYATDPDGDVLTYSLTTKPNGMIINPVNGLISWVPTSVQTGYNWVVIVSVSDGTLSDFQGFNILVSEPTIPPKTYTITASTSTGGSISPLGDVTVNKGANIKFTITPNTNYVIDKVLVDGVSVGAVSTYTFNNVAKDHTIRATFKAVEPEPEIELTGITVKPKTMNLVVGESEGIESVTAHYSDGSIAPIWRGDCTYTYTPILTVDSTGWVKAIAEGTATITVTYKGMKDTLVVTVTVKPVLLTEIVVEPKSMTLFVGEIEFSKVIAHYNFGPTKNVTYNCVYVSNDPTIAKVLLVSPSDFQKSVKAVGEGMAKITVCYTEGVVTKIDEIMVKVNPVLFASIVVEPETIDLLVGESKTIDSVTAHFNDGSTAVVALEDCTYTLGPSNVPNVVEVSESGGISAFNPGRVNVVVSYGGKTDTMLVIVSAVELTHIVVDPDEMTLFVEEFGTFKVFAHYNDTTTKNVTNHCDYNLGDLATVSLDCPSFSSDSRSVKALKVGKAIFAASYKGKTANIVVTVIDLVQNTNTDKYYHTIQEAIDAELTSTGDTIEVMAGTYDGFVVDKDNITIRATGEVIITIVNFPEIEDNKGVVINANGVVIEGLTIDGSDFHPDSRGILGYGNVEYTVRNAIFINLGTGIYANAQEAFNVELTAIGNTFTNCTGIGGTESTTLNEIKGNIFTDCVEGIGLGGGVQTTMVSEDELIAYLQDNNEFVDCDVDVGDWR
ncbi:hypothetical protein ES707_14991 [subsurface metagenome]